MASTSPEPPSTPEESGPLTPPLSPSSTEILETAAQHALNSEDPSFLIAVLNELDLPVLTYRSRMIMNHLIQYHPIPLCHRLSKIIFSPRDTITKVTSAVALELFKSFFSDDSWGEFIKPLLLDLKRDDYAVEIIPIINELVSHFNPHYIPENDWLGFTTAVCDNLDSDKEEVLEFVLSVINRLFIDGAEKILELSLETLCDKLKKILRSSDVSLKVKESAVEASFGCILRLKNAVNDKFLQDLLRKVMNTVFFNGLDVIPLLGSYNIYFKSTEQVFSTWLSHLPIKNNILEAKIAHDLLCSIVEISEDELLRQEFAYLPKIIAAFAEILWADDETLATEETVNRVIKQLRDFKSRLPSNIWSSILSTLEPSRQNVLQLSMSS
ncbi:hypothetical protein POTOM_027300 [Populus tomentosa]|uniref:ARM repeat superfamily protein n=1 Tax=Populus tomentosa TaxID=118781 RepID=A0A8X7ZG08_POPTO|nr:hypothetical protein POTOM_027300 [Populus tomentosa]